MRKNVILVNSLLNCVVAIQIRREYLGGEPCDIIISDVARGLPDIYESGILSEVFDNVYFSCYQKFSKYKMFRAYNNPTLVFKLLTGEDFIEYENIYAWNPTEFLKLYLIEMDRRDSKYNLHIYGDLVASYLTDEPLENQENRRNRYLSKRYNYKSVKDREYDFFAVDSSLIIFDCKRRVNSLPCIDTSNEKLVSLLTRLFKLPTEPFKEKCVLIDVFHEDFGINEENYKHSLSVLIDAFGTEDMIVKPHPRQKIEFYRQMGLKVTNISFPWEVYCLAYPNTNVAVSFSLCPAALPYLWFDYSGKTLFISGVENGLRLHYKDEYDRLLTKFNKIKGLSVVDVSELSASDLKEVM